MEEAVNSLKKQFESDLQTMQNPDELYLKYFSKTHGLVTKLIRQIPQLSPEEKKLIGPIVNDLQNDLKTMIETKRESEMSKTFESIDLTYKVTGDKGGMLHPTTQVIRRMNEFFRYYGFSIAEGPEIENAEYNFRRLNLPEGHPATDLQDTLFISEPDVLLRTHTSSIEARILTDYKPPIRAVVPGKVYRNETANATNNSFFYQYQGIVVDKNVTIQHLKGILHDFHKFLFGQDTILRFRYKYYPEVSPGMGVDMQCKFCGGNGCQVCKYRGYIEVLGGGMIHFNTLKMCGIDPEEYTGYAFGMGLDRLVMSWFGIDDIRKLYGEGLIFE